MHNTNTLTKSRNFILHKCGIHRYLYTKKMAVHSETFFSLWAKKELIMLFWPIFAILWCPVVTLVILKGIPKNRRKKKKKKNNNNNNSKNLKVQKIQTNKFKKNPKNPKKSKK